MRNRFIGLLVAALACLAAGLAPAWAAGNGSVTVTDVHQVGQTLAVSLSLHNVDTTGMADDAVTATIGGRSVPVTLAGSSTQGLPAAQPGRALLLIDTSGSMTGAKIAGARAAADAFVNAVAPNVAVGLASLGDQTTVLVPPTTDRAALHDSLQKLVPRGNTHLYDAVIQSVPSLGGSGDRLLVILTDGVDDGSSHTLAEATAAVRSSGVVLDAVSLQGTAAANQALGQLTSAGEGRVLQATDSASLADLFRSTTQELVSRVELTVPVPDSASSASTLRCACVRRAGRSPPRAT